jgi:hypothetical protein
MATPLSKTLIKHSGGGQRIPLDRLPAAVERAKNAECGKLTLTLLRSPAPRSRQT